MRFSVIIPAYNEEKFLPRLLDSIKVAAANYSGGRECPSCKSRYDTYLLGPYPRAFALSADKKSCGYSAGGVAYEPRRARALMASSSRNIPAPSLSRLSLDSRR